MVRRLGILVLAAAVVLRPAPGRGQEEDQVIPLAPIDVNAPWPLVPPTPKVITRPAYPEAARRHEEQGTVDLMVRVLRDGSVGEVVVKKSSGSPILDQAAIAEAKRWQFVPGHRGPKALDAVVEVPVRFQLVE
jgi:periplasmic protein TonB